MGRKRRGRAEPGGDGTPGDGRYYMISVVAKTYGIHPQTLRLYEREGLLKPSRTEGNTRLYSEEDLRRLEVVLNLTRDLGVNLAGVEIVLNMREKMERMQSEMNEFVVYVKEELRRQNREGWQERFQQALVRLPPTHIVPARAEPDAES
jgi:MerR family transcriptional regulator/heat shock protein HspR